LDEILGSGRRFVSEPSGLDTAFAPPPAFYLRFVACCRLGTKNAYAETKQRLSYDQLQAFESMGFEERRRRFESACDRTRR
jgi:hypothetical protein